ncbi:putative cell survival pathways protein [Marasmius crinis-equi]|uniref:Cell survival pathways protein n=1 Tax=Marasmius crinis-equi TaxID=585013 RepID=A0ABR3FF44_9AGAR
MFSSFFSTAPPADPTAANFHPVSSRFKDGEVFGELAPKDTEMLCQSSGFVTETQIFYTIASDGTSIMCQLIHSSTGMWYPTIQCVCKIHNPNTKETTWKSVNVNNFVCPPSGLDKRSTKADEFSITYKSTPGSDYPESYTVRANPTPDLQITMDVSRPADIPGYKVGKGDQGGYSYFGPDPKNAEGYVIHRFWPRYKASGHIVQNGKAISFEGPGMFVHAIQGMRPNLVAASWNFAHFQSNDLGGVSAIQMEFTTTDAYGLKGAGSGGVSVSVGSLVVRGKLVAVTTDAKGPNVPAGDESRLKSKVTHLNAIHDADTGYKKPSEILFEWAGPSILPETPGTYRGSLRVDVAEDKGLIEKVDILAEIPYVLKMAVNYVAGTKPYIYQWINPATLSLTEPGSDTPLDVKGTVYSEATFIS